jgi:hypothetical protein
VPCDTPNGLEGVSGAAQLGVVVAVVTWQWFGDDGRVNLDVFAELVQQRAARWSAAGIESEFQFGKRTEKPAAWVICSTAWSAGQLIVWVTGEADLSWVFLAGDKAGCTEHYEITSEIGLIGALDDLTDHLMCRRP